MIKINIFKKYKIFASYAVLTSDLIRYGWLSPDGKRYRCGYENHVFAAKELIDKFYKDENLNLTKLNFLLNKDWTRVTYVSNEYVFNAFKITDSLIEFMSELTPKQKCLIDIKGKCYSGFAEQLLLDLNK